MPKRSAVHGKTKSERPADLHDSLRFFHPVINVRRQPHTSAAPVAGNAFIAQVSDGRGVVAEVEDERPAASSGIEGRNKGLSIDTGPHKIQQTLVVSADLVDSHTQ